MRPPRPVITPPNLDGIPATLQAIPQWVLWRQSYKNERWTKIPFQADGTPASSTDPTTWATFEDVCTAYRRGGFDGIGFVVAEGCTIIAFDIDHCRNPETGELSSDALAFTTLVGSYWEPSPTGTGLRGFAIVRDWQPPKGGKHPNGAPLECYGSGRFLTVTGRGEGDLEDRTDAIEKIHAVMMALAGVVPQQTRAVEPEPVRVQAEPVRLDDQALIEKMFGAANGAEIRALWDRTQPDANGGYNGGDQALANHLAFWSAGNTGQMDRLFRQSARMRAKWDRADYRESTLKNALDGCTRFYSGLRADSAPAAQPSPLPGPCPDLLEENLRLRAELDQVRAENEALRRQPCERCAEAERQRDHAWTRFNESDRRLKAFAGTARNRALPASGRSVAVALAKHLYGASIDGKQREGGRVHVRLNQLAETAGVGRQTASRYVQMFKKAGVIEHNVKKEPSDRTESGFESVMLIRPLVGTGVVDFLEAVADYQPPDAKQRGGNHRCPNGCGVALVKRTTVVCPGCGEVVKETTQTVQPDDTEEDDDQAEEVKSHFGTSREPAPPVDIRDLGVHLANSLRHPAPRGVKSQNGASHDRPPLGPTSTCSDCEQLYYNVPDGERYKPGICYVCAPYLADADELEAVPS